MRGIINAREGQAGQFCIGGRQPSVEAFPIGGPLLMGKASDSQTLQQAAETVQRQAEPLGDFRGSTENHRTTAAWPATMEELLKVGDKRINLMRIFNLRAGIAASTDVLPQKIF